LFCQVLWNLTIPKKTQNFSKHPISTKSSSSSRHCKQLFVSFKIFSTLSTSLLQNSSKSQGAGC
jgi:hypothetical protein